MKHLPIWIDFKTYKPRVVTPVYDYISMQWLSLKDFYPKFRSLLFQKLLFLKTSTSAEGMKQIDQFFWKWESDFEEVII